MDNKKLAALLRLYVRGANAAASSQDSITKRVVYCISKGAEAVIEELEKTDA